jgi:drug/metabolite transporter (DMT)-like permease
MTERAFPLRGESTAAFVPASFLAVYILWGSTYLAIRIGIESLPPLILAAARYLILGAVLYAIYWLRGQRPTRAQWRACIISGVLLFCTGNGLVCWAELRVPTGIAALLIATVSFWMVLADWLRPGGVRPVQRVVWGLIVGFSGLIVLVGPAHLGGSRRVDPLGAAVLVIAALSWAIGSVYAKHTELPSSLLLTIAMQSLAAGSALTVISVVSGESRGFHLSAVTLPSGLAVLYLMLFGSVVGFSAYLYILRHSTATRVGTYAFVNPVVALFLGWLFAGEAITLRTLLAAAIILTAVVVVIVGSGTWPAGQEVPLSAGGEA